MCRLGIPLPSSSLQKSDAVTHSTNQFIGSGSVQRIAEQNKILLGYGIEKCRYRLTSFTHYLAHSFPL